MDKRLLELAVDIVQSQSSVNKMSGEEIEAILFKVYNALNKIQHAETEGRAVPGAEQYGGPALSEEHSFGLSNPGASIQEDRVICMECGVEFRQLTANHLRSHGLSPREYKRKWGFPLKQPLAAKVLTKLRSKSAKKRGLPQRLRDYLEDQRRRKQINGSEQGGAADGARRHIRSGPA